jgi:regulator of sigma E protease
MSKMPLNYEIKRGKETLQKTITPQVIEETKKAGIGISIAETGIVRFPWYKAIVEGFKLTGLLMWAIVSGLAALIGRLFSGGAVGGDVVGPVGIAALTGQMADMGFAYLAQFAAILSLHLAIINFIPFPALDGGRVLFLIIEKFKGSPVRQKTETIIHNIGFILLIGLIIIVTFKDIIKLF